MSTVFWGGFERQDFSASERWKCPRVAWAPMIHLLSELLPNTCVREQYMGINENYLMCDIVLWKCVFWFAFTYLLVSFRLVPVIGLGYI